MRLPSYFWRRVIQAIVGLFFIGAAYFKLHDSFFGKADVPLAQVFHYWLDQGWPMWGYRQFMQFMLPYTNMLGATVIACQGGAGLLLVYNARVRLAAFLLLFVQLNIFLGTYNHIGFNVFVGTSLWIGLFYFLQGTLRPNPDPRAMPSRIATPWWTVLTLLVILLCALSLKIRFDAGDPWLSSVAAQRAHYAENIMSVSPILKHWILAFFMTRPGEYAWASVWWIYLLLTIGLIPRNSRLFCVSTLAVLWMARDNIWENTITSEGVLWVLFFLTFATYEEEWRRYAPPVRLLPSLAALKRFLTFTTEWRSAPEAARASAPVRGKR